MISLFPETEGFQLSLFDVESYTDNRQVSAFEGFLNWFQNVKVFGSGKTAIIRNVIDSKTLKVEQLYLRFSV